MASLRLIADDLTGALDTAAEFAVAAGPVRVTWSRDGESTADAGGERLAFDCATRERDPDTAAREVARAAQRLGLAHADLAFLKLDSLLRGHAGPEIRAAIAAGGFDRVVIAPAFPFQGRITRAGAQLARFDGAWRVVGEDLSASLPALGVPVSSVRPGDRVPDRVSLWDAETQDDLVAIVTAVRAAGGRVLWCGSGGLAGALAGARSDVAPAAQVRPIGARPVLGLFGTDHPVTAAQLARIGDLHLRLADGGRADRARLAAAIRARGVAFASFELPVGIDRPAAARAIEAALERLLAELGPPALVVCGGGETLRSLCRVLGTGAIDVTGRIVPGVPRSVLRGGRWDGVDLVSKSGAFGDADLFSRMVARDATPGALRR